MMVSAIGFSGSELGSKDGVWPNGRCSWSLGDEVGLVLLGVFVQIAVGFVVLVL